MGDLAGEGEGFKEVMNWWVAAIGGTGVCAPLERVNAVVENEGCGVSPFFGIAFLSFDSGGECAWE